MNLDLGSENSQVTQNTIDTIFSSYMTSIGLKERKHQNLSSGSTWGDIQKVG